MPQINEDGLEFVFKCGKNSVKNMLEMKSII